MSVDDHSQGAQGSFIAQVENGGTATVTVNVYQDVVKNRNSQENECGPHSRAPRAVDDARGENPISKCTEASIDCLDSEGNSHHLSLSSDANKSLVSAYLKKLKSRSISEKFDTHYIHLRGSMRMLEPDPQEQESLWPSSLSAINPPSHTPPKVAELENIELAGSHNKQYLVMGKPGCGKTTFLKYMLYSIAKKTLDYDSILIPLLINLTDWPEHINDLASLIYYEALEQVGVPVSPHELVLLLDGISKIDSDAALARIETIKKWMAYHRETTVIIAARSEDQNNFDLPSVKVLPLDDMAIVQFVGERLGEQGHELLAKIDFGESTRGASPRDIIHLARNPFLLQVMCLLYKEDKTLPSNRGRLIQAFVQQSYHREKRALQKKNKVPELSVLIKGFGALAATGIKNKTSAQMALDTLQEILDKNSDSQGLQRFGVGAGLVEGSKDGKFLQFSHPLLLEYFAAEYLLQNPQSLPLLLHPPIFKSGIRIPRRLDETIFTMLNLGDTTALLSTIRLRDPFLAVSAINQGLAQTVNEDVISEVASSLVDIIKEGDGEHRLAAVEAMVQLGEVSVPHLRQLLGSDEHWTRRVALSALSRIPAMSALEGVILSLFDSNRWVRRDATIVLQSIDEKYRPLLIQFCRGLDNYEENISKQLGNVLFKCWIGVDGELADLVLSYTGQTENLPSVKSEEDVLTDSAEDRQVAAYSEYLDSFGYYWRTTWDSNPGDLDLVKSGRSWLKAAPREHPSWGSVWTAIWAFNLADREIEALGRKWLSDQPATHESWSYLWAALWNEFPNDPELIRHGYRWLEEMSPCHRSWPYIWRLLFQFDPGNIRLQDLGVEWLQQATLQDEGWGIVWPLLWETSRQNQQLMELAQKWLEVTEPTHPGWGYVWQALWKRHESDAELEKLGRGSLSRVKFENPVFGYIWSSLYLKYQSDRHLKALGRMWLDEVPPEHDSWGYVWKPLLVSSPPTSGLIERGYTWLETANEKNKGWSVVWQTLWEKNPGDSNLVMFAMNWIEKAPASHWGWGYIWRDLKHHLGKNEKLTSSGRNWLLSAPPFHAAWGYIWLDLYSENPGNEEIIDIGFRWLKHAPITQRTWSYLWEVIHAARPQDKELEQRGRTWLSTAPPDDVHWAFVWERVWDATPGERHLEEMAWSWLAGPIHERKSWSYVWTKLYKHGLKDRLLIQLGINWLKTVPNDDKQWFAVWSCLAEGDAWTEELRIATQEYLASRDNYDYRWLQVWSKLAEIAEMPNYLIEAGGKRGLAYRPSESTLKDEEDIFFRLETSQVESSDKWTLIWRQAWDADLNRHRLVMFAIYALEKALHTSQWAFIWRDIFNEVGSEKEVMRIGGLWVRQASPLIHGWGIVWDPIVRSSPTSELIKLGWSWMRPGFFRRSSWSQVWRTLWELEETKRPQLAQYGKEWIYLNRSEVDVVIGLWYIIFSFNPKDDRLIHWGIRFLKVNPKHSQWPEVASKLWSIPALRMGLIKVINRWITENRHHPCAAKLRSLVLGGDGGGRH